MSVPDDLIAALADRLSAFSLKDPNSVLDPQAVAEARVLLSLVTDADGRMPLNAAQLVAWLHWYRYWALPEDQEQEDLRLAIALFSSIAQAGPHPVPELLRKHVPPAGGDTDADWHCDTAVHLLGQNNPAALNLAIALLTIALDDTSDDDPNRGRYLANLGAALLGRFQRTGAVHDLDEAIRVGRQAVRATPDDHPNRGAYLFNLGSALNVRFGRTGAKQDLDEAIRTFQDAAAATSDNERGRNVMLSSLGGALRARFSRTGDVRDLDEAIRVGQDAVAVTPDDHPHRAEALSRLSNSLQRRFERTGAAQDLNEAIRLCQDAVAATPKDHPYHAERLSQLGGQLLLRFQRTDAVQDLDEAIRVGQDAVAATAPQHPGRAAALSNFGCALRARFERTDAVQDVDQAIAHLTAAVAATRDDDPERGGYLHNLGGALVRRFERTGAAQDLDEAILVGWQAVQGIREDHPERAALLSMLGVALQRRFERSGAVQDLDQALTQLRTAVAVTPDGHPDRGTYLHNLGAALEDRFGRTGAVEDLDEAIRVSWQAVEASSANHRNRSMYMSGLGNALLLRFERTGARQDLDQAIALLMTVAEVILDADDPHRAKILSNLGAALRVGFEHTGAVVILDEAIRVGRQAVQATSDNHPDRAAMLSNLGATLLVGFEHTGAVEVMDEAVRALQDAVAATSDQHPGRAGALSNLGGALRARFQRTKGMQDLDEAIRVGRQAVQATPDNHPDRAMMLSNLGNALLNRFECRRDEQDLNEAVQGWAEAAQSTASPATTRITAARLRSHALAQWRGPAAAVEAYTEAVKLLPLLAWRGISHRDQEHRLYTSATSLARDAAACAVAAGRLDLAVELLESGRGVYWSQLLGTRTDVTALQQVAPELAAQLRNCRAVLEQPAPDESMDENSAHKVEARMRAARLFDAVVEQVRALPPTDALPHPDSFLKTPPLRTLLPGADDDPIVIINISRWRCDALALTYSGVTLVEFPELTDDQVIDEGSRYLQALEDFERRRRSSIDRLCLEMAITTTLEWLWDHIAGPILQRLGHTTTPVGTWPTLCWCPTGALTVLPVHAAGYHRSRDTVMDRVVSSYTPTVRAMTNARTGETSPQPAKILIIALPDTPGQNTLPGATAERDLLTARFAPETRTVLTGSDATRHTVLTHLGRHRWLHASCHGTQNLTDPSTGGLVPYDWNTAGLITVTDLTSPEHTGGEFAFLSACKTATGGVTNLDEAITVAAAMQHAGWRHVIGTLWSVWDDSATTVAENIYPPLLRHGALDPSFTALALHRAIHRLRDTSRDQPSTWAPFIHTGP